MRKIIIMSEGYANGVPGGAEGMFLKSFDPYADPAKESVGEWTDSIADAMTFENFAEAGRWYRHPLLHPDNTPVQRPDGSGAERPLTAFSVTFMQIG